MLPDFGFALFKRVGKKIICSLETRENCSSYNVLGPFIRAGSEGSTKKVFSRRFMWAREST